MLNVASVFYCLFLRQFVDIFYPHFVLMITKRSKSERTSVGRSFRDRSQLVDPWLFPIQDVNKTNIYDINKTVMKMC